MEVALIYFAVLLIAFFVFIVRPQRRRLAAHRQFVSTLSVGDEVVTTGGIFGTVRALQDDRVGLEIAPRVLITVARAAVAQSANPLGEQEAIPSPGTNSADNGPADNGGNG